MSKSQPINAPTGPARPEVKEYQNAFFAIACGVKKGAQTRHPLRDVMDGNGHGDKYHKLGDLKVARPSGKVCTPMAMAVMPPIR